MSEGRPVEIDKLIHERTEEKRNILRKTFQENINCIRDRKTHFGINVDPKPFPDDAFEQLKSKQVWKNVLKYLSSSSDITSAYFTCRTFANHLEERRTLMLLPKVLQILKKKDSSRMTPLYSGNGPFQQKIKCWNIRQVSKAWKEVFDTVVLESNFRDKGWFLTPDLNEWNLINPELVCIFESRESVNRAISCSPSSSLLRRLKVSDYNVAEYSDGDLNTFLENVMVFLYFHGDAVWFFWYDWNLSRRPAEAYQRLRNMVQMMPNLKGLFLDGVTSEGSQREFRILRETLRVQPFPVLDYLEHLDCTLTENPLFLTHILRNCINLKSIISHDQFISETSQRLVRAMKALALERYEEYKKTDPWILFAITCRPSRWRLKILTIEFHPIFYDDFDLKSSFVFPALNRYRNSLQSLRILNSVIKSDNPNIRLDLPQLKFLSLPFISYFDWMLPLKSLEHVQVEESISDFENEDMEVKVFLEFDTDQLSEKSNVWDCFQNLKKLEFCLGRQVFSRHFSHRVKLSNSTENLTILSPDSL